MSWFARRLRSDWAGGGDGSRCLRPLRPLTKKRQSPIGLCLRRGGRLRRVRPRRAASCSRSLRPLTPPEKEVGLKTAESDRALFEERPAGVSTPRPSPIGLCLRKDRQGSAPSVLHPARARSPRPLRHPALHAGPARPGPGLQEGVARLRADKSPGPRLSLNRSQ